MIQSTVLAIRPIITVEVQESVQPGQQALSVQANALIDTGASSTGISPLVATSLNLTPSRTGTRVVGDGSSAIVNFYKVVIYLPNHRKSISLEVGSLEKTLSDGPINFDVIIGMDILAQSKFTLSANAFTLDVPDLNTP